MKLDEFIANTIADIYKGITKVKFSIPIVL